VHLAAKYGSSVEHARAMQQHMTDVAATEGLDFRFDLARGGNMFDAHRVIHLAKARGLQDAMEERLFRAYLTEGEVVGDHAVLTRVAVEVGLDEAEVRDLLAGEDHAADVRDDERIGASLGITGVPFFVVDRAIGASGAQPSEVLLDLLRQGWAARSPVTVVAGGESCGVDGC
jgi:predicted DsbA family dithiol-disulfide isomerase